ncbi:MAG: N-acetylmuramoyl-L-alanine amidase [Saprospiraceae bacterium]
MRYYFLIIISLFINDLEAKEKERFHKTIAQNGDGVYSLLRRYKLLDSPCNLERFYELNRLKRNANLAKGKSYFLPILIYEYNRKSIRTTIGIDDWDLAIRIQEYNKEMVKLAYRPQDYMDDSILWVPYHEMYCSEETKSETVEKPESVKLRSFPIFGKKHEKVPLLNKSLEGKIYYIVSGHGGIDPGAVGKVGKNKLCEDEYAYDVAVRLAREIVKRAGTAYLILRDPNDGIRDEKFLGVDQDEIVWGNYKVSTSQKGRLFQRSDVVNELIDKNLAAGLKDQRLIAIHVDSRSKSAQTDVFFYHFPGSDAGKRIANNIKKTLSKKYKKYQKNRGYRGTVTARDLHMLREPKCTSVYVELGNIANQRDQKRFLLASNRQLLAEWLMEGFIK